jgi:hypothetical protein
MTRHFICHNCWAQHHPGQHADVRLEAPGGLPCCRCGHNRETGNLLNLDPATLPCKGVGGFHEAQKPHG